VKFKNYKNLFKSYAEKLNAIELNSILEKIKNFKIDDLKELNYKRLLYDIRNSQYLKPSIGLLSASLLTTFLFFPAIQTINSSFRKVKKYKSESTSLPNKISELKNKSLKFEEIKIKIGEVNSSFIKNEQIIFIAQLLNETAKKTDVNIISFSPIFKTDSSKLCKASQFQKKSKKFKSVRKKNKKKSKGLVSPNYFELTLKSDYLDVISFLKEIQLFDVIVIPYCLEVNSLQNSSESMTKNNREDNSIIIPLNKENEPLISYDDIKNINNQTDSGNVETKIVLKIPSLNK